MRVMEIRLDADELAEARAAIAPLAARLQLEARNAEWEPLRYHATHEARARLELDDVSGVPFVAGVPGVEEYQHRARVRARSGGGLAAVTPPADGYEAYNHARLGLGAPWFHCASRIAERPFAVSAACRQPADLAALAEHAREAGAMVLHPYMGIEEIWLLARELGEASGVPVSVLAPPPAVTWLANDKAHLSEAVALCVDPDALLDTHETRGIEELFDTVRAFRGRYPSVGIKRTRCASAMGNLVLHEEETGGWSDETLRARLEAFLKQTEWDGVEPVLVVQWARTDLSPSTQLWVPPLGAGDPVCEGVYEQLLVGEEKCFLGSRPSTLPGYLNEGLAHASLRVAAGLQAAGYVGRCSFDFVVTGDVHAEEGAEDEAEFFFVECNGRWGGTSTPMALVDRCVEGPRPDYIAKDVMHPSLAGAHFKDVLARFGDTLFDAATQEGRFLLYNVGPLQMTGKLDVIALGESPEDAEHAMNTMLPSLLGIS